MSFLQRTRWCSKLLAASLSISCAMGDDDDDDHPPICEDCTNPAPEAAIPTGAPADSDPDQRPLGGFTSSSSGGHGGFAGRGGTSGSAFGPFTGGRSDPFDTSGGSFATGASFGTGGSTFDFGGSAPAFAGSAGFGGF